MSSTEIPGRTITTCDRCRVEITDETKSEFSKTITRITETTTRTQFRMLAIVGNRLGDGRARVLRADVHFCGACLDEFDLLFCQGKAVPAISDRAKVEVPA